MVPAVEDFSQKAELIERSGTRATSSMSSVDEDEDMLVFKGERLLTHEQLREGLKVCSLPPCHCRNVLAIVQTPWKWKGCRMCCLP